MRNEQHTPGPWEVLRDGPDWTIGPKCNAPRVAVLHGLYGDDDNSVRAHNARLIAASPSMKDAITIAGSRISDIMDGFEPGTPVWASLQKVMFGLYESLPKSPATEEVV